jgi:predicted nuclease of restriction endonuclease-like RecB superfamily
MRNKKCDVTLLPSNLFSAKVRKGKVVPNYVALDGASVSLAKEMIGIFEQSVGKKKAYLSEKL